MDKLTSKIKRIVVSIILKNNLENVNNRNINSQENLTETMNNIKMRDINLREKDSQELEKSVICQTGKREFNSSINKIHINLRTMNITISLM